MDPKTSKKLCDAFLDLFSTDECPAAAFVDIADPAYDPAANAGISFEQVCCVSNAIPASTVILSHHAFF